MTCHYTGTEGRWGDLGDTPAEIREIERYAASVEKPSFEMDWSSALWGRSRSTRFSPCTVGWVWSRTKNFWPAIDVSASGTRREELLMDPKELELVYRLRKVLSDMNVVEAMELMKNKLGKSKSNAEFLMTMNLG